MPRAKGERKREDQWEVDAKQAGHFFVLDAGPEHGAHAQRPPAGEEQNADHDRHRQDEQAVCAERRAQHVHGAAEAGRRRDGARGWTELGADQIDKNEREAEGEQHLREVPTAVKTPEENDLECRAKTNSHRSR